MLEVAGSLVRQAQQGAELTVTNFHSMKSVVGFCIYQPTKYQIKTEEYFLYGKQKKQSIILFILSVMIIIVSAICCDKLTSSSNDSNTLTNFAAYLGSWSLFTIPEHNDKKVYQLDGNSRVCLNAKDDGSWQIGSCSDLTSNLG